MIWKTSEQIASKKSRYSRDEIREFIVITRLSRYNRGIAYGAKAIRRELENFDIKPLPSLSCINYTLKQNGLTHRRTGIY